MASGKRMERRSSRRNCSIKFVDTSMNQLKNEGVVWGYDLQYLMTGLLNQHPRAAIQFTKEKSTDYTEFYREIVALD